MSIQNFIGCRISNFKLWYLRLLIRRNIRFHDVIVDIGCGKTKLDYVTYDYGSKPHLLLVKEMLK